MPGTIVPEHGRVKSTRKPRPVMAERYISYNREVGNAISWLHYGAGCQDSWVVFLVLSVCLGFGTLPISGISEHLCHRLAR